MAEERDKFGTPKDLTGKDGKPIPNASSVRNSWKGLVHDPNLDAEGVAIKKPSEAQKAERVADKAAEKVAEKAVRETAEERVEHAKKETAKK